MSSDDGASTRVRKREGGTRYAHERVARRNPGRSIRTAAVLLTVGAAAILGVLAAGRAVALVRFGPHLIDSTMSIPDSTIPLPHPNRFGVDPTPIIIVAGFVWDASLIVAGLATGVGGCLLCVAAIRVRGWR